VRPTRRHLVLGSIYAVVVPVTMWFFRHTWEGRVEVLAGQARTKKRTGAARRRATPRRATRVPAERRLGRRRI
jgi:hypothetical protein